MRLDEVSNMNQNIIVLLALLCAAISNVGGNFLYQRLSGKKDWRVATERTFFQLIAIVCVGISYAIFWLI